MGKQYIETIASRGFDSYECDNCGEGALVLAGVYPAGWQEEMVHVEGVARFTGTWRCPVCRKD